MLNDGICVTAMFAQIERPLTDSPIGKLPGLLMGDIVLIVFTGLAVLGLLMYWARYLRNRRSTKKEPTGKRVYRDSAQPESADEAEDEAEDEGSESRRRYKYRWKRRTHRRRKPTLAETGGLPPSREDEEAKSS